MPDGVASLTWAEVITANRTDPRFDGVKLVLTKSGRVVCKCMRKSCFVEPDPHEALPPPRRPQAVVATLDEARGWAMNHYKIRHRVVQS